MIAGVATALSSVLSGSGGGGGGAASQPDTVTIDTGDTASTVGGGSMNLAGSGWSWVPLVALGFLAWAWMRKH